MRWEQGIGWSYSIRWDDATKSAGKRDAVRPYRSPSTRLLRTGEEKQRERWTKLLPPPIVEDGSTANMQHTRLHRPVSLPWKQGVSHRNMSQHHMSRWTEISVMSFSTVSVTHTITPMQHTCTNASLTGQGAKRERTSLIWTEVWQRQDQKLIFAAGIVALHCKARHMRDNSSHRFDKRKVRQVSHLGRCSWWWQQQPWCEVLAGWSDIQTWWCCGFLPTF